MVAELFTVVALPHSRAAGADFHVSLFISPRLTPDGAEGELRDFTLFPHWAALLQDDATFELRDQDGVIEATPLLGAIEPAVWDAVFPPRDAGAGAGAAGVGAPALAHVPGRRGARLRQAVARRGDGARPPRHRSSRRRTR